MLSVALDVAIEHGVVFDDAFSERFAINSRVAQDTLPGAWVIENVACHDDFRRRGLIRQLLQAVLDRGRARGSTTAQVSVFIGNDAARDAYLAAVPWCALGRAQNGCRPEAKTTSDLLLELVVGTGVDPVTFRFSGGRSAD